MFLAIFYESVTVCADPQNRLFLVRDYREYTAIYICFLEHILSAREIVQPFSPKAYVESVIVGNDAADVSLRQISDLRDLCKAAGVAVKQIKPSGRVDQVIVFVVVARRGELAPGVKVLDFLDRSLSVGGGGQRYDINIMIGKNAEPTVIAEYHSATCLAFRNEIILYLRNLSCFRIKRMKNVVSVHYENQAAVVERKPRKKREFAVEVNVVCGCVKPCYSIVGLGIKYIVRQGKEMPDHIAEEVIVFVGCLKRFHGIAVPDIQSVCGADVYVSEIILVEAEDSIV